VAPPSTLLSGGGAETHSGSGVWLVFSLRTLVCADGICGRVRTFVTRVACSVVNSFVRAFDTHGRVQGPAPPSESARARPTPDTTQRAMSAWQPIPGQVGSHRVGLLPSLLQQCFCESRWAMLTKAYDLTLDVGKLSAVRRRDLVRWRRRASRGVGACRQCCRMSLLRS
jgi:hypothetical protein